jgi:RND family efflux transporter MFP subunit
MLMQQAMTFNIVRLREEMMYILRIITITILFFLSVVGCKPEEKETVAKENPRAVRTAEVVRLNLPVIVKSVGRLIPNREVLISAQVGGILQSYSADVGERVTTGQCLAEIDATDYKLALAEAKANHASAQARLAAAESALERARALLPKNVITPDAFEKYEADYKSTLAVVAQLDAVANIARQRLKKTCIQAPFDGFITQRYIELGQNMGVRDPIMNIADMENMRVKIHIAEQDYVHLDRDDPVTVKVEAFEDRTYTGTVDKIGIKADPQTNTFAVEILVENAQNRLKAGLTARVHIEIKTIPDTIMIAQDSVLYRENRKEVFVVEDGRTATVREVKIGRVDGSRVQILDGLEAGDKLVVSGAQYLKPGNTVTLIR